MHNRSKKPQLVKISSVYTKEVHCRHIACSYLILREYIDQRSSSNCISEPFFIFGDKSPVRPHHMQRILKLMLSLAGFEPGLYNTHSFRIGRCIDLLKAGISEETIKKLGCWKTNCVFTYLSHA